MEERRERFEEDEKREGRKSRREGKKSRGREGGKSRKRKWIEKEKNLKSRSGSAERRGGEER